MSVDASRTLRRAGRLSGSAAIPGHAVLLGGLAGSAYNEAAFRHFLAADRRRAVRSQRSLLMVLVAIGLGPGRSATLTDETATAIFQGLIASLRDVDFVGWYRERQVAAAVLASGANATDQARAAVAERLIPALRRQLPGERSANLRVRVVQLGDPVGARS